MPNAKGMPLESEEQTALFQWAAYVPDLKWMFAIPNGGTRNPREARNLKRQGVKAGVSDIFLPLPRGKYHGLFIEMKVKGNKPTEKQLDFLKYAQEWGYMVKVAYGFREAQKTILDYLNLGFKQWD